MGSTYWKPNAYPFSRGAGNPQLEGPKVPSGPGFAWGLHCFWILEVDDRSILKIQVLPMKWRNLPDTLLSQMPIWAFNSPKKAPCCP